MSFQLWILFSLELPCCQAACKSWKLIRRRRHLRLVGHRGSSRKKGEDYEWSKWKWIRKRPLCRRSLCLKSLFASSFFFDFREIKFFFYYSWISALTNKVQNILFGNPTQPNHFDSFPAAAAAAASPGIRRGCFVPRLYLTVPRLLIVWLLMNTSLVWIQITSQKTVLIRVLTIRTAETCDDFITHKTLLCCFQLIGSIAPPNGRRWCWGEGCLWDTETGSQFSAFHPRLSPPSPVSLLTCFISAARSRSWSPVRFNHCLHMAFPAVLRNQENMDVRQIPTRTERWLVDLGGLCWGRRWGCSKT